MIDIVKKSQEQEVDRWLISITDINMSIKPHIFTVVSVFKYSETASVTTEKLGQIFNPRLNVFISKCDVLHGQDGFRTKRTNSICIRRHNMLPDSGPVINKCRNVESEVEM